MKVFVTGATGFVGTAVMQELLANGHQVLGLARSEESADKLIAAGAEVHRGDLNDFESLKSGATASDAVIHLGFVHDFTRYEEMCELDGKVIETIGGALLGTDKPFLITSGTAIVSKQEGIILESDLPFNSPIPRVFTENAADKIADKGVRAAIVRLPPSVHGEGDKGGFVPMLITISKEKGISAIINNGDNVWPAVHRFDAAKVYVSALEKPFVAGTRYHAVAEQGIKFRDIATAISEKLQIPLVSLSEKEAEEHFTWFVHFATLDNPTSSAATKEDLFWSIQHPSLLEDIGSNAYFAQPS